MSEQGCSDKRMYWRVSRLKRGLFLRVMVTVMLIGAICGSLITPARGNGTSISIEPSSVSVTVGQKFTVQIWVRGVVGMERFYFDILWDTSMMTYVQYTGNNNGVSCARASWSPGPGDQSFNVFSMTPRFTGDAYWWSLQFQCLAAGTASLSIINAEWRNDNDAFSISTVSGATVQQNAPQTIPPRYVGGEVFSANKLAVLSPYLALISIVAVAAVVVKRKLT